MYLLNSDPRDAHTCWLLTNADSVCVCLCFASYIQVGSSQTGAEVVASRPEVSVLLPDHLQHELPRCLKGGRRGEQINDVCVYARLCREFSFKPGGEI